MASLLRLQARFQGPKTLRSSNRPLFLLGQRSYAQKSSSESNATTTNERAAAKGVEDSSPNHPIPSNKAEPTLRDGTQSPMADMEGNLKEDLPEDVKQHNEDVEHRYDRPYNHTGDDGNTEPAWKRD
ncbi:hypothetical protein N7492_008325 [Penicillium capsulatum]|uniref:Uncharacterized protein n=1 Tax=Penicillium capsulatum TaxID=69766 RepID=A0A9W9HRG3_9EURO|nr:hypothetical protein N7492_008325 [Penicillium capsulatum]